MKILSDHPLFSKSFLRACCSLLASCLFIPAISAQIREPTEFELKAALLYNFALFTEWPPLLESTFNLCLYGQDPFGVAIQVLTQKSIRDRPIRIQRLNQLPEIETCHLLYIHALESSQFNQLITLVQGKPVLTVTDIPAYHDHGSIINLGVEQKKIRFDIDLAVANHSGLSISSKLLRLARHIHQ
jgi:hypothetical protein